MGAVAHSAQVARRVDAERGIVEEAGFFGEGQQRVFGVTYLPKAGAEAGVVICPAVFSEYDTTYGLEVGLARALASRGIAVHRFAYRGSGHSDGEPAEMTFDTMRE